MSGAISASNVLLLMCSNASPRSRNERQAIPRAWTHPMPYLPLLLELELELGRLAPLH